MTRVNNTWNKDYCPSPCEKNGKCPDGAQCIDLSDEKAPNYTCVCRHAHISHFLIKSIYFESTFGCLTIWPKNFKPNLSNYFRLQICLSVLPWMGFWVCHTLEF